MTEIWKEIENFSNYEISTHGRIKNKTTGLISVGSIKPSGYVRKSLYIGNVETCTYVHRLVAQAFIPNQKNLPTVNHKDHNPKNNHVDNLEWSTHSEQIIHQHQKKERKIQTNKKILQIDLTTGNTINTYPNIIYASKKLNIKYSRVITMCKKGIECDNYKLVFEQDIPIEGETWKKHEKTGKMVSSCGRIKTWHGNISCGTKTKEGYMNTVIKKKNYFIHRLVAETFLPNPKNLPTVNHKDANKSNNNLDNLEWATKKDQMVHIIANNLVKNKPVKKVTQYTLSGKIIQSYDSIAEASRITGANNAHISAVCKGKENHCGGYKWGYTTE